MLRFDLMRRVINFLEEECRPIGLRPRYSITTNGSLLTPGIMRFLDQYRFLVELSFDGLAQEVHREQGSFTLLESRTKALLAFPNIRFEVNSVFTPQTVDLLFPSVEYLMDIGVANIRISLSPLRIWNRKALDKLQKEFGKLRRCLSGRYEQTGTVPVVNFRGAQAKGIFACSAGKDRVAITPRGDVWGCHLFPDLLRKARCKADIRALCLGRVDKLRSLEAGYAEVLKRHERLSQDTFTVRAKSCLFCPDLEACEICPLYAAFAGTRLGEIPGYICAIQRMHILEIKKFHKAIRRFSV